MKTMLELLIRLHAMRCCCERVKRNPQLTNGEKSVACFHKQLVRECLPVTVLNHYDRMKKTERALLPCPEVFAMAVLVAAYRSLSPLQRRKLVRHFKTPVPGQNTPGQWNAKSNRSIARREVGQEYIVPSDFNREVVKRVTAAVTEPAINTRVARKGLPRR